MSKVCVVRNGPAGSPLGSEAKHSRHLEVGDAGTVEIRDREGIDRTETPSSVSVLRQESRA